MNTADYLSAMILGSIAQWGLFILLVGFLIGILVGGSFERRQRGGAKSGGGPGEGEEGGP